MNNNTSAIHIAEVANGGIQPPVAKNQNANPKVGIRGALWLPWNYLRRDATALGFILLSI